MINSPPFSLLFDRRSPGKGRDFNWEFFESDLNDSARRLLHHVDRLFTATTEPGWVFLVTIENDAEAGRFPEVAANFFASESWSISARYFVAAMGQLHPEPKSVVGRVSFECSPNQLGQVLAQQNGFRWGSNLSVGGIQVRETDVPEALQLNPFVSLDGKRLEALVRFAWAASRDLDELGLFVSPGNDDLVEKLFRLLKA